MLNKFYHHKQNPHQLAGPSEIQGHGHTWTNSDQIWQEGEDLENVKTLSVIYSPTSYPESQWFVISTILFAGSSVDVQFGAELREDCSSLPTGRRPGSPGLEGPRGLSATCGSRAGCRPPSVCVPETSMLPALQQDSLDCLPHMVAQKLPLLKVCNCHSITSATFRHPRLQGEGAETLLLDGQDSVCIQGWGKLQVAIFANNLPQTPLLKTRITWEKSRERKWKMTTIKHLFLPICSISCPWLFSQNRMNRWETQCRLYLCRQQPWSQTLIRILQKYRRRTQKNEVAEPPVCLLVPFAKCTFYAKRYKGFVTSLKL